MSLFTSCSLLWNLSLLFSVDLRENCGFFQFYILDLKYVKGLVCCTFAARVFSCTVWVLGYEYERTQASTCTPWSVPGKYYYSDTRTSQIMECSQKLTFQSPVVQLKTTINEVPAARRENFTRSSLAIAVWAISKFMALQNFVNAP